MEDLLREILAELQSLNSKLQDVIDKLPDGSPIYNIDDIYNKIESSADDITGPTGYSLGDIHAQLVSLQTSIESK